MHRLFISIGFLHIIKRVGDTNGYICNGLTDQNYDLYVFIIYCSFVFEANESTKYNTNLSLNIVMMKPDGIIHIIYVSV